MRLLHFDRPVFKQPRLFGGADVHELVQHVGASLPKLGSVAAEHGDLQDVLRTGADFRVVLAGAKMVPSGKRLHSYGQITIFNR